MTESSTPRTDAALADAPGIDGNSRIANFMRDLERELAEQKRALSEGSFADGFRAARKLASDIVGAYTDGDCPFDSTIAVMVDKIDRLMPLPEAPK